jgi:hypothetical protein
MSQNTIHIPEEATSEDLLNGAVDCLGIAEHLAEEIISPVYSREIYTLRILVLNLLVKEFG